MSSFNQVILLGNVGQDPQVRVLENGTKVVNISVATSQRGYTKKDGTKVAERTEWHNVVLWRSLADVAEKFVKKGTQIHIIGELRSRNWTDGEGNRHYVTEIMANQMNLLGKGETTGKTPVPVSGVPTPKEEQHQQPFEGGATDDDLPF